jgi:hypothetical protein
MLRSVGNTEDGEEAGGEDRFATEEVSESRSLDSPRLDLPTMESMEKPSLDLFVVLTPAAAAAAAAAAATAIEEGRMDMVSAAAMRVMAGSELGWRNASHVCADTEEAQLT